MPTHYFFTEDLGSLLAKLKMRRYAQEKAEGWTVHSKVFSRAVSKSYAHPSDALDLEPVQVRVTYDLLDGGKPLQKVLGELKELNRRFRKAYQGAKGSSGAGEKSRRKAQRELLRFHQRHEELIACFEFEADERVRETGYSFNLQVASTPKGQGLCLEFIKALAEARTPHGIVRGRRTADKPVQQRNGWIKRYAQMHRKRGWRPLEIVREIQKELRNGTWNERAKLQYNIADNTIGKIAGIKIPQPIMN